MTIEVRADDFLAAALVRLPEQFDVGERRGRFFQRRDDSRHFVLCHDLSFQKIEGIFHFRVFLVLFCRSHHLGNISYSY